MWIKDCPCMQQQIRALFMQCNVSTQEVNERNLKPIYFTGQWTRVLPRKKSRPVNCSQSTSSLVLLLASSSLEATNFSVLFVWLPGPDTPRPGFAECCCWKKKRAPPFFNFVFSSLLLCDVPWWCYTIVVWTQDNSWCYLVYFVGVALWCLHKNPFSGYFLVFIWIKKYDVLCTIHTMILPMHGGLLICKKTKWRFFTKEFLWLSLYTSIRNKQKAWNICEEAYIC